MSRRTLATAVAALAATVALAPGVANAAGPASASGTGHGRAFSGTPAKAPRSSAFTHFSSPAAKSFRVQAPELSTVKSAVKQRTADTGTVIYASTASLGCSPETGDGTQANPFCQVQDAVDAAVPGDTVDVLGTIGYFSQMPVKVTTSNISIVGIGQQAWISANNATPALTLDGVTGVTVSNLMLNAIGAPAVEVIGSSDVTLDSDYVTQQFGSAQAVNTVTIDGTSSGVTVSRTYLDSGGWAAGANAVSVASGASNITLASNVLADAGITATGVSGLDITGNTIQRGCSTGIDVEGTSTGVSIENNLLEDANPGTDGIPMNGYQSTCAAGTWAPDVTVSTDASTGTTADYNDFYVYGSDATAPYSWAGTAYPTLAAFRTGASQGSHDTDDSVQSGTTTFRPNEYSYADAVLKSGSAAIGSANPAAPGALATDFYGHGSYTSRGALGFVSTNPSLSVSISGEDTSAYGVSLSADVKSSYTSLSLTVNWGDGTTSQSNFYGGQVVPVTHVYKKINKYSVTFTVSDSDANTASNTTTVWTAGSDYTAYGPTRLLDTRYGTGVAKKAKVAAHGTVHLKVGGSGTIPVTATAAVLNVTATNPTAAGFITAYDDGDTRPTTSNVNFVKGQTVPNQVIVPIGQNGDVDLYNSSSGTVDLIADIAGYFTETTSSGYSPLSPYRLVDTRNGTGAPKKQLAGHSSVAVQIAGNDKNKLPSSGITAVALNVTVTGSKGAGFLTAYPDGKSTPTASNVNFSTGQTIANSVIAPVGTDGKIRVYNGSTKAASVIVDVVGFYSAAGKGAYLPIYPTRYLDTRDKSWTYGPLGNGDYIDMPLSPDYPDVTGWVLNATVTSTKGTGYLTVSPDPNSLDAYEGGWASWPTKPSASSLNWVRGKTVPNLVQASTGSNGIIDFWNTSTGTMNLVVDGFGYYQTD